MRSLKTFRRTIPFVSFAYFLVIAAASAFGQTAPPPTCSISVSPGKGARGQAISASGSCTTSSGLASMTLDFGDGTPPTTQAEGGKLLDTISGSHAYPQSGNFTVTVSAIDVSSAKGSSSQGVVINDPPTCTFSVDKNSGPAPLTVNATANCTDTENDLTDATIFWGDGVNTPLSCQMSCQPLTTSHTYQVGRYTAQVQAHDTAQNFGSSPGQPIASQAPPPTCTLVLDKTSGTSPLTVNATGSNCTSSSGGFMDSQSISWGDGTTSSQPFCDGSCSPFSGPQASHTFNAIRPYRVTLTGKDFTGSIGSDTKTVTVFAPPPVVTSIAPTRGQQGQSLTVQISGSNFVNSTVGTNFNFGSGVTVGRPIITSSNAADVPITISQQAAVGPRDVTATNPDGQSGTCQGCFSVAAPINEPPTCTLSVTPLSGTAPLTVTATGNCSDPENDITNTTLDFGDGPVVQGSTSGTHTYTKAGTFTVKVSATDKGKLSGSASQAVAVSAPIPLVYIATVGGNVFGYSPDGNKAKTLNVGFGGSLTGMGFDAADNLYVTGFTAGQLGRFDTTGTLQGTFGTGYNCEPESIAFDDAGNAYVGQAGCTHDVLKFDSSGKLLANFHVVTEDQGSDWVDLAADQCTLFYTSEGSLVFRYDVCRDFQLPNFAAGLHKALAIRLLGDGGLLVADNVDIHRLDSNGKIATTYDVPGEDCWVGLTLDLDGKSFWAADYCTSNVYKFAIDSGAQLFKLNTGTGPNTIFGLGMNSKASFLTTAPGTMTATPTNSTVKAGQAASYTVTIQPSSSTSGKTFTFSCANLPPGASCSFSPPSFTVGTSNTSSLTITTTPSVTGALVTPKPPLRGIMAMLVWLGIPVAGITLISFSGKRRKNGMVYVAILMIAFVLSSGLSMTGCGGGSRSDTTKAFVQASTPSGTYTVLVVGVSGSTQTSVPVTLVVQ